LPEGQFQAKDTELQAKDTELQAKDTELQAQKEELEDRDKHVLLLKDLLVDDTKREKLQVVYISTSRNYAKQNRSKPGGVEKEALLRSRLSTYNSRSAKGDEWYFYEWFALTRVPKPLPAPLVKEAVITTTEEDGTTTTETIQADTNENFRLLEEYINKLGTSITSISRKKVFDDLKVLSNFPLLQQLLAQLRPNVKLLQKS